LAPSDEEEEEHPSKKARINAIQKSVERVTREVMGVAKELGIEDVHSKCLQRSGQKDAGEPRPVVREEIAEKSST
jgi:hypothetical protein